MRLNGTLQYEIIAEDEYNEFGEIVSQHTRQRTWSDVIDCQIQTNTDTRKGRYDDGEFRMCQFTVLTELIPVSSHSSLGRVRLTRLGENLGEFRVASVENLMSVGRTQIVV